MQGLVVTSIVLQVRLIGEFVPFTASARDFDTRVVLFVQQTCERASLCVPQLTRSRQWSFHSY